MMSQQPNGVRIILRHREYHFRSSVCEDSDSNERVRWRLDGGFSRCTDTGVLSEGKQSVKNENGVRRVMDSFQLPMLCGGFHPFSCAEFSVSFHSFTNKLKLSDKVLIENTRGSHGESCCFSFPFPTFFAFG